MPEARPELPKRDRHEATIRKHPGNLTAATPDSGRPATVEDVPEAAHPSGLPQRDSHQHQRRHVPGTGARWRSIDLDPSAPAGLPQRNTDYRPDGEQPTVVGAAATSEDSGPNNLPLRDPNSLRWHPGNIGPLSRPPDYSPIQNPHMNPRLAAARAADIQARSPEPGQPAFTDEAAAVRFGRRFREHLADPGSIREQGHTQRPGSMHRRDVTDPAQPQHVAGRDHRSRVEGMPPAGADVHHRDRRQHHGSDVRQGEHQHPDLPQRVPHVGPQVPFEGPRRHPDRAIGTTQQAETISTRATDGLPIRDSKKTGVDQHTEQILGRTAAAERRQPPQGGSPRLEEDQVAAITASLHRLKEGAEYPAVGNGNDTETVAASTPGQHAAPQNETLFRASLNRLKKAFNRTLPRGGKPHPPKHAKS